MKQSLGTFGFPNDFITRIIIGRFLAHDEESRRLILTNKQLDLQRHYGITIPGSEMVKALRLSATKSLREILDTMVWNAFQAKTNNQPFIFNF